MYSAMLNRRRLLALMGATASLPLVGRGFVSQAIAADGTVTIAYNVNLPSFDPTVGA
jgi:peptide/nickel transport system substrate-binding protein